MSTNPVVLNVVPIPINDIIAALARPEYEQTRRKDPNENKVTQPWVDYFTQAGQFQTQASLRVGGAMLPTQSAAIGATDISGGGLGSGLYRFEWYAQITQAATVSSSLTITLDWRFNGQNLSYTGAAITGNTLTTYQIGPPNTGLIMIDGGTPVRYSATYATVGATPMQYFLGIALTRVNA